MQKSVIVGRATRRFENGKWLRAESQPAVLRRQRPIPEDKKGLETRFVGFRPAVVEPCAAQKGFDISVPKIQCSQKPISADGNEIPCCTGTIIVTYSATATSGTAPYRPSGVLVQQPIHDGKAQPIEIYQVNAK